MMPIQTLDLRLAAHAGFVLHGVTSGDLTGIAVSGAGDINGDGLDDLVVGASFFADASGAAAQAGRAYVVFGRADRHAGGLDLAAIGSGFGGFAIIGEAAGDAAGRAVAGAGDINGDGFDDLVIGAPNADGPAATRPDAGAAYVIFGKAAPFDAPVTLAAIAAGSGGFVMHGAAAGDMAGFAVGRAGDIDGDGLDDLAVAALDADGPPGAATPNAGAAYVLHGASRGFAAAIDLAAPLPADRVLLIEGGNFAFDETGTSIAAAGDINADGRDDLVIGAPNADGANQTDELLGSTYVLLGRDGGHGAKLSFADIAKDGVGFIVYGEDTRDEAGFAVSSAGDFNGDGIGDLIIGAPNASGPANARFLAGDTYVLFGRAAGFAARVDLKNVAFGTDGFVIQGRSALDRLGNSVASVGDVNGDGFDDLAITAFGSDGPAAERPDAGETYLLFGRAGPVVSHIDIAAADWGVDGVVILGADAADQSGVSVSGAGDIDGDGYADLVIGAFAAAGLANERGFAGDAHVIYGGDFTGSVSMAGTAAAETLAGTGAVDTMVGGAGGDTLIGQGGADALSGGVGDDVLRVPDASFRRIDGGRGTDTLKLDAGEGLLDLQHLGRHRIRGIEVIDLAGAGANGVIIDRPALQALPDSGTTLRVIGGTESFVLVADPGWTEGARSDGMRSFANGAARLLVAPELQTFLLAGNGQAVLAGPPVAQNEGNSGTIDFVFTMRRLGDVSAALLLDYSVVGIGTRPADAQDFAGGALPSGSFSFAAGATESGVTIQLAADTLVEANENFAVIVASTAAGVMVVDGAAVATIIADDAIVDIAASDGVTGAALAVAPSFYTGPVAGIEKELILLGTAATNVSASGAGWFIHTGSGSDAIAVFDGTNVLDGGTGSNFLTGGTGPDTFFVDARGATDPIWSTVNGLAKGDAATLWGVSQGTHVLDWVDGQGAPGFTGLTLHASAPGQPTASLTLPGYDLARKDTALAVVFGFDPASSSNYMYVSAI